MAGDHDLIADAAFTLTIRADTCNSTWGLVLKALLIHRRRHGSCTTDGSVQGILHLVHPRNNQHRTGAVSDRRHPIAGAVDTHHLSVQTQSIGAG